MRSKVAVSAIGGGASDPPSPSPSPPLQPAARTSANPAANVPHVRRRGFLPPAPRTPFPRSKESRRMVSGLLPDRWAPMHSFFDPMMRGSATCGSVHDEKVALGADGPRVVARAHDGDRAVVLLPFSACRA